jgi:hypothetical protein
VEAANTPFHNCNSSFLWQKDYPAKRPKLQPVQQTDCLASCYLSSFGARRLPSSDTSLRMSFTAGDQRSKYPIGGIESGDRLVKIRRQRSPHLIKPLCSWVPYTK